MTVRGLLSKLNFAWPKILKMARAAVHVLGCPGTKDMFETLRSPPPSGYCNLDPNFIRGEKKAHKHKLFALVNVQMALGQTAGCPNPKRPETRRNGPEMDRNQALWGGAAGGFVGMVGVGVIRGKENH